MIKVFIDGNYGAAGFCLEEKLQPLVQQNIIKLIQLPKDKSKNENNRYEMINLSDISVLCLPEEVSAKTCLDLSDCNSIIINASTYHRTLNGWTYGYQELNDQQTSNIIHSKRIANPGCFANGLLSILNPLKEFINPTTPICMTGVTGYSAGGKKIIQKQLENPLQYRITNLNQEHIHVKEVKHWLNFQNPFAFMPSVSSFERGQMVSLILFRNQFSIQLEQVYDHFVKYYSKFDKINVFASNSSVIIPEKMNGRNDMEIHIAQPSHDYIEIHSLYDNLGKGSAGSIADIISKIALKE